MIPTLDDGEIAVLERAGRRRPILPGEYLYREGDVTYDFFVILSGEVEIVLTSDGVERLIIRHGPRRFLGELNLITGQRVFLTARVVKAGEALAVPAPALRRVIATNPALGDKILAAFMARRADLLSGAADSIRVIGSHFSPDSVRVRDFLARNRVPHEWLDPDRDREVDTAVAEFAIRPADLPVVIVSGTVLRHATPGQLAEHLGLTAASLPERHFDLLIVGGGPAGLAAAVYGASEGLETLAVDMTAPGGQAGGSSRIENYLGFPTGISGGDLTERALIQAERFGAQFVSPCRAAALSEQAGVLALDLSDESTVTGRAVIAATGARYRRLDAERLADFEGVGVYYAATEIEARECAPDPVVVVGGGNSAGQAALFLADAGSPVTIIIRRPDLSVTMSRYLIDRIEAHPRVEVRPSTSVTALDGDGFLSSVRITGPGGQATIASAALFSFIGADPSTEWLSGVTVVDERGFVLTDRSLSPEQLGGTWEALGRRPLPFETSHPGLFAAGDIRSGSTKRVAAAVGEGSAAVRSVHAFLGFAD